MQQIKTVLSEFKCKYGSNLVYYTETD